MIADDTIFFCAFDTITLSPVSTAMLSTTSFTAAAVTNSFWSKLTAFVVSTLLTIDSTSCVPLMLNLAAALDDVLSPTFNDAPLATNAPPFKLAKPLTPNVPPNVAAPVPTVNVFAPVIETLPLNVAASLNVLAPPMVSVPLLWTKPAPPVVLSTSVLV